jgi:hypothetical protein
VTFADLSPSERVEAVERYMVELADGDAPMSSATRAAIRRAQLVLADDLPADEHAAELDRWRSYVDALPTAQADAALDRLRLFWQLYDGLVRAEGEAEP